MKFDTYISYNIDMDQESYVYIDKHVIATCWRKCYSLKALTVGVF